MPKYFCDFCFTLSIIAGCFTLSIFASQLSLSHEREGFEVCLTWGYFDQLMLQVLKRAERSVSEEDIIAMTEIMVCDVIGPLENHISACSHSNRLGGVKDAESLQNNEEWSMEDTEQRSYKTIEHGLKSSIRTSMSPMPIIVKVVRNI